MRDLFKLFTGNKQASKDTAKERLKLVLVNDRGCSDEILNLMKGDLLKVIETYMDVDQDKLDVKMTRTRSEETGELVPALVANIPVRKMKKVDRNS